MEEINKHRKPLSHAPTAPFTMKREEYKTAEDLRLISHFASWLSKVSEKTVSEDNFEKDLLDGIVLCRLMKKINGADMINFHENIKEFDGFKAKENIVFFQNSCKKLHLPINFGTEDLEKKNISRIVSTLIFLAHVAHSQGVTVKEMDQEILDKVEEITEALEGEEKTSEEEEPAKVLKWYESLLIKIGLGEWIESLSVEAIKKYLETLQKNVQDRLPEAIKAKLVPATSSTAEGVKN